MNCSDAFWQGWKKSRWVAPIPHPRLRWPRCLATELKSMIVLMVVLGEFSLAASVSVFFIYTAELLPTVLR